jgi:amicyanin
MAMKNKVLRAVSSAASLGAVLCLRMSFFAKPVSTPDQVRGMLLAGHALAAALFFSPMPALAADAEVKIDNFTFNPPRLVVKAGTTVTWDNDDDIPHTVVATAKAFRSKTLDTEDKYSFTFTTPGTYEYFCSLHPHMTGSIVVEAVTGATQ